MRTNALWAQALSLIVEASKHSPLLDYVIPGLTSSLLDITPRVFEYDGGRHSPFDLEGPGYITPHSHRYSFCAIVLEGEVRNTLFEESDEGALYDVRSLLYRGTPGSYHLVDDHVRSKFSLQSRTYSEGGVYFMGTSQVHTIEFAPGTKVLMLEGPTVRLESKVLLPVVDGKVINTMERDLSTFFRSEP